MINRHVGSSGKCFYFSPRDHTLIICLFKQEVGVIKNIVLSNGYSYNFINKHVKHFLNRQNASDNTFTQIPTFGPELRKVFIRLPYCGINSIKLKRQLERVLKIVAPWTKLNIIFKPYYCLSNLSKLKSPVPVFNRSYVVYKIDCLNCDDFYIGMTRRRLHKRLKNMKLDNIQQCANVCPRIITKLIFQTQTF